MDVGDITSGPPPKKTETHLKRIKRREKKKQLELRMQLMEKGSDMLTLAVSHVLTLWNTGRKDDAFACAMQVMPYFHPKLQAVAHNVEGEIRHAVVNGDPLTIDEFNEQFGVKAEEPRSIQ